MLYINESNELYMITEILFYRKKKLFLEIISPKLVDI